MPRTNWENRADNTAIGITQMISVFLGVVCSDCKGEQLVAFSCKHRGFCPSCGARRMAESAVLLVDDVLRGYPIRPWVRSLPIPHRLLLARYSSELSKVIPITHPAIFTHNVDKAGFSNIQAKTGASPLFSASVTPSI